MPTDIFNPRSIAILGASGEAGKIGHRPLEYLRRYGYGGRVYPVNPSRVAIQGWSCYRDLADVPGPIDAAMVSLAASLVPAALEACAIRGVKLALVLTSGVRLEAPAGLLAMGPNSMGFLNVSKRAALSWSSSLDLPALRSGRVGLISQSGALGGSVLNRLYDRGVGLSYAFWSGNEDQIDTCHLLRFLLDDPETSVVALVVEGFRRPLRFLELAELALAGKKPLVAFKLAQAASSAPLAVAHTGILAGSAPGYRAAFRQSGVIEVESLDELVDTTALFSRAAPPPGDGLGVISSSGGAIVLVNDLCQRLGIRLPALAPATRTELKRMLPAYAPEPINPIDITAGLSEQALFQPLERLAADPSIDLVLNVITMLGGLERQRERGQGLIEVRQRVDKPIVSCWTAGSLAGQALDALAEADQPFFTAPELCLRGLKALFSYGQRLRQPGQRRRPAALKGARGAVRAALVAHRDSGRRVLGERESAPLLAAYGLPLTTSRFAATSAEAVALAGELGYPVALKADAPGLAHRWRAGGVRLDLAGAEAVAAGFGEMRSAIGANEPAAHFRGVLVQPLAPPGLEAVLGTSRDPHFGPIVLAGLGGVHAEALAQVALRLAPLRRADAIELIDETPLRAIKGRRHLLDAVVRLGWFAADLADLVEECDLNPVRVYKDRVLGLDALIVLRG